MKSIIFVLLFVCNSFLNYSQKKENSKYRNEEKKVDQLITLSNYLAKKNKYDDAIKKRYEALALAQKINYPKGLFYSYFSLGKVKTRREDYREALFNFQKALNYEASVDDDKSKAIIFEFSAICYEAIDNYKEAMYMSLKALSLFEKTEDSIEIADMYNNIGIIHSNQQNYRKALTYFKRSLKLRDKIRDSSNRISTLNNIGIIYLDLKELDSAISIYQKCIRLNSANIFLSKRGFEKNIMALVYNNLGLCYQKKQLIDSALYNHRKSLQISQNSNYKKGIALSYLNIGMDYFQLKQYKKSIQFLRKAQLFSSKYHFLFIKKGAYHFLAELHEQIGEYKESSYYYKVSADLNDSIYNLKFMENINELNQKYETEKKNKELLELQTEKKLKQLEIDKEKSEKRYLIIVLFVACILIVVLVIFSFIVKKTSAKLKLTNQIILNRNSEILQNKDKINQQAIQIAKYQSQMNPHFIFNAVNGLQGIILKGDRLIAVDHLHRFTKLLRLTLNNSEGDYLTLNDEIDYLYKYVEFELYKFSNKYNFSITVSEDIDLNYKIPTMLIQPMIENAIKHAGLSTLENGILKVKIELITIDEISYIQINIIDNGVGFSTDEKEHISKGISITKHRIYLELIKNNCDIENYFSITNPFNSNGKNVGTKITMLLPFNSNLNNKLI